MVEVSYILYYCSAGTQHPIPSRLAGRGVVMYEDDVHAYVSALEYRLGRAIRLLDLAKHQVDNDLCDEIARCLDEEDAYNSADDY